MQGVTDDLFPQIFVHKTYLNPNNFISVIAIANNIPKKQENDQFLFLQNQFELQK